MASPSIPDLGSIAGPVLLATCLNWGLYGALCVQAYFYYLSFPHDKLIIKSLVAFWIFSQTVQTILLMHDTFFAYGTHFGSFDGLDLMQLNWLSVPVITGIVSLTVQVFFAHRVWVLSKVKLLAVPIVAMSIVQSIAAIISGVQAAQATRYSLLQKAYLSTAIWLTGGAFNNVLTATLMIYLTLTTHSGFCGTDLLPRKFLRFCIETGALIAIVTLADVSLFLAIASKLYHAVPATVAGKLYTNTAIAILNSRINVIGGRETALDERESTRDHYSSKNSVLPPLTADGRQRVILSRTMTVDPFVLDSPRTGNMDKHPLDRA